MSKEVVYVSGPISAAKPYDMEQNIRKGMRKGGELAQTGVAPIVPHGNSYRWAETGKFGWKDYMRVDLELLKRADSVYMMQEWKASRGARIEERYARLLGKKVVYEDGQETREARPQVTLDMVQERYQAFLDKYPQANKHPVFFAQKTEEEGGEMLEHGDRDPSDFHRQRATEEAGDAWLAVMGYALSMRIPIQSLIIEMDWKIGELANRYDSGYYDHPKVRQVYPLDNLEPDDL